MGFSAVEVVDVCIKQLFISVNDNVTATESITPNLSAGAVTEGYIVEEDGDRITEEDGDRIITEGGVASNYVSVFDSATVSESNEQYRKQLFASTLDDVTAEDAAPSFNLDLRALYVSSFDGITVAEDLTSYLKQLFVDITDTATVAEDFSTYLKQQFIDINDTAAVSEALDQYLKQVFIDVFDSVTASEDITSSLISSLSASIFDGITVSESVTANEADNTDYIIEEDGDRIVTEDGDGILPEPIPIQVSTYDTVAVSDVLTASIPDHIIEEDGDRIVTEDGGYILPEATPASLQVSSLDSVAVTDTSTLVGAGLSITISKYDSAAVSENLSTIAADHIITESEKKIKTEAGIFLEPERAANSVEISVYDGITVGENISPALVLAFLSISKEEAVSVSEDVAALHPALSVSAAEDVAVSEFTDYRGKSQISVTDDLTAEETVTALINNLYVAVYEELGVTETNDLYVKQLNPSVVDEVRVVEDARWNLLYTIYPNPYAEENVGVADVAKVTFNPHCGYVLPRKDRVSKLMGPKTIWSSNS